MQCRFEEAWMTFYAHGFTVVDNIHGASNYVPLWGNSCLAAVSVYLGPMMFFRQHVRTDRQHYKLSIRA